MNEATYCVSANAWLQCAFALTWKVFLVGCAWSWIVPAAPLRGRAEAWNWLIRPVVSALTGLLLLLLTTLVLAEAGWYRPLVETVVLVVLAVVGFVLAARAGAVKAARHVQWCLPGLVVFWMAVAAIMHLPARGEWVLGGWDPGIYLNQGVYVEKTGTFYPEPLEVYTELDPEEVQVYTRGDGDYRECFPGVPLDMARRVFRHYFFRLTPTLVAVVQRCGGLRAATRVNTFVGFLALAAFFVFLLRNGNGVPHAIMSLLLLASSPVWIYHLHEPTSEMLHLLLLCSVGIVFAARERGRGPAVLLGLLLAALVLNRVSFLPLAGALLVVFAWFDRARTDRSAVLLERCIQAGALLLAGTFDLTVTSITLMRLQRFVPILTVGCAACVVLALVVDAAASWRKTGRWLQRVPLRTGLVVSLVGAAVVGFLVYVQGLESLPEVLAEFGANTRRLMPFLGIFIVPCALLGSVALFGMRRKPEADGSVPALTFFFLAAGILILSDPEVAERFPWATRRHLIYTVPVLAILAGKLFALPWEGRVKGKARLAFRGASVVVLCVVLGTNARRGWHAWSRTEYNGATAALLEVAKQIPDDAYVVVDHPWWGTPLTFIYGKQVLNGKHLWTRKDEVRAQRGIDAAERLMKQGKRVLFLTTKPGGLSVYPVPVEPVRLLWKSEPVVLDEIVQHPKVTDFKLRRKEMLFQLFEYGS